MTLTDLDRTVLAEYFLTIDALIDADSDGELFDLPTINMHEEAREVLMNLGGDV